MSYLGDYSEDASLYHKFSTRAFATGVPTTLAGTPVLSVYKDEGGAGTEKTTAETYFDLDVDHDSITGYHNVRIDLSGDAYFATGADYSVVITTGTVGGTSVVGEALFTFSIENRHSAGALRPTTAGRTLDVSAGGEAGIDWSNVGGQSTSVTLNNTTVGTTTTNTDMRGTDSALLASSAPTNFGDLAITVTTGQVTVGTNSDKTGYALTATTGLGNQTANITGTLSGTVGGIAGTITTLDALDTAQDTQHSSTQGDIAALNDIAATDVWAAATRTLTAGTNLNDISVADVLTTQMTEAYNTDGAAPTLAEALHLIIAYLTERSVSGTTVTAKKLDGSTTAATFTLDDGTNPTSVTRAT